MPAPRTAAEIRDVNERYHDVAASSYDRKWGIDFGETGRGQVLTKLDKALRGDARGPFGDALEIGSGTGYFSLNLMSAGVIERGTCTDLSPGMLATLRANAEMLGLDVETAVADAEDLPFPDESFDLVFGHAVLHHIPDLERAMGEFLRVLRPGGLLAFAGEPSRYGDRLATVPKRGAQAVAPFWRALMRADSAPVGDGTEDDHSLERYVDVHAFVPGELAAFPRSVGFEDVHVRGEELLANWFGWSNRALEATADPDQVPWLWRQYAYRGYIALQHVDRQLLETRLPPGIFYNLILSARKPD